MEAKILQTTETLALLMDELRNAADEYEAQEIIAEIHRATI